MSDLCSPTVLFHNSKLEYLQLCRSEHLIETSWTCISILRESFNQAFDQDVIPDYICYTFENILLKIWIIITVRQSCFLVVKVTYLDFSLYSSIFDLLNHYYNALICRWDNFIFSKGTDACVSMSWNHRPILEKALQSCLIENPVSRLLPLFWKFYFTDMNLALGRNH